MTITLLDGAMGQELVGRYGKKPTGLWSTAVMMERPDLVQQVHADYFAAGAIIATTNTYAVHRDRLAPHGIEDQFKELHLTALDMAKRARDAHGSGFVAGSLGPLGWSYRPDLAPESDEAAGLYAEIAEIHAPHVDFFIAETMASIDMAIGVAKGLSGIGKPLWMALTVDDRDGSKLRSGEPVAEVAEALAGYDISAFLLNCSLPEVISDGINALPAQMPRGAYANGFTEINLDFAKPDAAVDTLRSRTDLDPEAYGRFASRWLDDGASIIGGCCEIGPAHIAHLRDLITESGHTLSSTLP